MLWFAHRVWWVFDRAFNHAEFKKIAAEFFLEAGVLWLVFPILDTVVQFGGRRVTWKLAALSIGIAVGCLTVAGWLSRKEDAGE